MGGNETVTLYCKPISQERNPREWHVGEETFHFLTHDFEKASGAPWGPHSLEGSSGTSCSFRSKHCGVWGILPLYSAPHWPIYLTSTQSQIHTEKKSCHEQMHSFSPRKRETECDWVLHSCTSPTHGFSLFLLLIHLQPAYHSFPVSFGETCVRANEGTFTRWNELIAGETMSWGCSQPRLAPCCSPPCLHAVSPREKKRVKQRELA